MNKKSKKEIKEPVVLTEANKLWDEIKNKDINMFALPNQKVSDYCKPAIVEPSRLYLLTTASAALPSLENALGRNYTIEVVDKYLVISKVPTASFKK